MKVRHKRVESEQIFCDYDVLEESPGYYICRSGDRLTVLPKQDYEPAHIWRDVTGECEFTDLSVTGLYLTDRKEDRVIMNGDRLDGNVYRLRKVKLKRYDPVQTGDWKPGVDYVDQWAFVVEKLD